MSRALLAVFGLWLCLTAAAAQTRAVDPADLSLSVVIENPAAERYPQEMVLLTIQGVYRRHITLESLEQPGLADFNWMQLGEDFWFDSTLDGRRVKNFRRRMALFPQRAGQLTIPPFIHHLQLVDEGDDWFTHDIQSAPLTLEVSPRAEDEGWWFPARRLSVSDNWSNAPDQLAEGAGVLRIIRIEATGVGPEMIPPMPELTSPSAMIFAHPEKRLVELSPEGPVSVAFWRWTVRPSNGISAILEPLSFDYFDTVGRQMRTVTISAQRVAMADAPPPPPVPDPVHLSVIPLGLGGVAGLLAGLGALLAGRSGGAEPWRALGRRWPLLTRDGRALWRAARRRDLPATRRAAVCIAAAAPSAERRALLHILDRAIFARDSPAPDLSGFARTYLGSRSITLSDTPPPSDLLPESRQSGRVE